MNDNSNRNTLFVEEAEILSHEAFAGEQYLMRILAPECASHAAPGTFAHLTCHPLRPMRRPLSIMRVSPEQGWVEFLYKSVGEGTRLLSQQAVGNIVNCLGPIGNPFQPQNTRPRTLLIGGGVGMPPMIFLADVLRRQSQFKPLVLLGSEVPFPFRAQPSQILTADLPDAIIAAMPLLDDWGIPSRLASQQSIPGCFPGFVTELAEHWLGKLSDEDLGEVAVFACGPHPMLEATAKLCADYSLPCEVSLEEFMACAVGGCAGCTVEIMTANGSAMRRVCVDGPVFKAHEVFPSFSPPIQYPSSS